jgi:prepilin peptidase CpaA
VFGSSASYVVLVLSAALLFYMAVSDLREFKIRNDLILVLGALFFVHAIVSGRWTELHWNLAVAAVAFALMLLCYSQGLMGGGDLKLMTVALLWTGARCALPFLIILVAVALLHSLAAKLGWVGAKRVNGRIKIAFAPSIAAALIGVFMLGCLAPK